MSNINDFVMKDKALEKSSSKETQKFTLPHINIYESKYEKILVEYIPDNSSKTIIIPEDVEIIDQFAFDADDSLTFLKEAYGENFQYPDNIGTKFIEKILINKRLIGVENYAFCGLENLKIIEVDKENPYFIGGDTLFYTKKVSHPNFIWCSSQKTGSYTVPSWITAIGPKAFANSKLDSVILLEKITYIWDDSFENCKNLVIKGYKGSYAEEYAKENGMPFEAIEIVIKGYEGSYAEKYAEENGIPFEAI